MGGLGATERGRAPENKAWCLAGPRLGWAGLGVVPCLSSLHAPVKSPLEEFASGDLGL